MPDDDARQRDLAAVVRAVAGGPADLVPDRLLRMAVAGGLEAAPGAVGCSITEQDGSRYRTTVYAGELALGLDLVQYQAGAGPCLSALRDQRSYLADDPAVLDRAVPGWAQAAARFGVGSVLSLPLPGQPRPAGINFYGAAEATFRPPVVAARAALVSRLAGRLLLGRPEGGTAAGDGATGPAAVSPAAERQRDLLVRARAVIARAEGLTEAEAFAWLAQQSRRDQRGIAAVAQDVLDDELRRLDGGIRDEQ
jgi:hypothetical protein